MNIWYCHIVIRGFGIKQGLYSLSRGTSYRKISRFEVLKPWDSGLNFPIHSEIWQAPLPQRCRDAYQISERYDQYNIQSRVFETSQDLAVRRLTAFWIEDQGTKINEFIIVFWNIDSLIGQSMYS